MSAEFVDTGNSSGTLSTQVRAEFYSAATRKLGLESPCCGSQIGLG